MSVVLVEPNAAARAVLKDLLRGLGVRAVSTFADPEIALRFLLGRLREVSAVVVNEDDEGAAALLRRLRVVPSNVAPIPYSGRKLACSTKGNRAPIAECLADAVRREA